MRALILSFLIVSILFSSACGGGTTVTNTVTQTQTETFTVTETQTITITTLTDIASLIEILSVLGPLEPINPGGPIVEITLKNVAAEPIVYLSATLELNRPFDFTFDVTHLNPLLPNESRSSKHTLIGGGFGDNFLYTLKIALTLQSGANYVCTTQIQITEPTTG